MSILTKIFGDPNEKIIKSLQPIVNEINGLEEKFAKMSDEELAGMTIEFRKRLGVKTDSNNSTGLPLRQLADRNDIRYLAFVIYLTNI